MYFSVITQACDQARRKFSRGEQSMLIDIFNGTILTPGLLGQHLIAQVEDSFDLYPGTYEEKWGASRQEMIDKIISLAPVSAAFLELWAVGFWALNQNPGDLKNYLAGKLSLDQKISAVVSSLRSSIDRLEKTKGSFKSPVIGDVRSTLAASAEILAGLQ